jgi:NAD-dependent deacetylase
LRIARTAGFLQLVTRLRRANGVTVLTGAGVSAASGVPTFRGSEGLWRNFSPTHLASPEAFAHDPRTVWEWYEWRREQIARCEPNAAHRVLAEWSRAHGGWRIVTQNVDDLHLRAGTHGLVRLHGSIWELACHNGCRPQAGNWRDERVPLPQLPPRCPGCGGLARPAVVWFGEALNPSDVDAARSLASSCDVFITAGTSAVVQPAAALVHIARAHGAFTAEMNLEHTAASGYVDLVLRGPVEETLSALCAVL